MKATSSRRFSNTLMKAGGLAAIALHLTAAQALAQVDPFGYDARADVELTDVFNSSYTQGCDDWYAITCFSVEIDTPANCQFMVEYPIIFGPAQYNQAVEDSVPILMISTTGDVEAGGVKNVILSFNYVTNIITVTRQVVNADKAGTTNLDYDVLDDIAAKVSRNIQHLESTSYILRAYLSEKFLWLSLYDGIDPLFSDFTTSPLFFGLGPDICTAEDPPSKIMIKAPEAYYSYDDPKRPYSWVDGKDPMSLRIYTYSVSDFINEVNIHFSQRGLNRHF